MFPPYHFSSIVTNRFFLLFILFISLISSHSPHLSNFHLFSLQNPASLPFFPTIWFLSLKSRHLKLSLSPSSFIFSMAPKSKKTSYVLSSDAFNLIHWNGVVRLNESLPMTYRPQDHLLEGARTGSVSFSKFSHFPLIFHLNMFLDM